MQTTLTITNRSQIKAIPFRPSLEGVVSSICTEFSKEQLPAHWKLMCRIDSSATLQYLLKAGVRAFEIVPERATEQFIPSCAEIVPARSSEPTSPLPVASTPPMPITPVRPADARPKQSTRVRPRSAPAPPGALPAVNPSRGIQTTETPWRRGGSLPQEQAPRAGTPSDLGTVYAQRKEDATTNRNAEVALNSSADALEELEALSREVLQDTRDHPSRDFELKLQRPPMSAYEVCLKLGVESSGLAATSPPLLKSPRYRISTSPDPRVPEEIRDLQDRSSLRGPWAQHLGDARASLRNETPVKYHKLLALQSEEMELGQRRHRAYQNHLSKCLSEAEKVFDMARDVVENGEFNLITKEADLKQRLAELAGISEVSPKKGPQAKEGSEAEAGEAPAR